jgi:hypothetical protein
MHFTLRQLLVLVLIGGSAVATGCYHIKTGGPVTPPTGSFTGSGGVPTPTPHGACNGQDDSALIVEVSPEINYFTDPTYGKIGEYAPAPASGGFPSTAAVVHAASGETIQFANVDTVDIVSAVGLGSSGFPATPHTFPSGTQNPIGTAISSGTWSTGLMSAAVSTACFSQTFTLPTVTGNSQAVIYFGDYNRYNYATARDVIVVTAGSGGAVKRYAPPPLIEPMLRPVHT